VGMLQAGGKLDLAQESFGAECLGHFRMEHLECHRPVVAEVVGKIHHGHPTTAELAFDAVLAGERSLEATQSILQAGPGERFGVRLQRWEKRRKVRRWAIQSSSRAPKDLLRAPKVSTPLRPYRGRSQRSASPV